MKQDSSEPQVGVDAAERPVPGASLARRLFSRGATRASVGPRASFYHRLGLDDPYGEAGAPGAGGPFTYLSSAAYFRDLRRSRLGLLSRIEGKQSGAGRLGARLRAIGPAAAEVRPSILARLGLGEDDFTVLEAGPEVAEEEPSTGYRIIPRAPKPRRERAARRPAQQAMHREAGPAPGDDLSVVLERLLAGVRGSERVTIREIVTRVVEEPPARRERAARALVRGLRGPARALARLETEAVDASGQRPTQVAAGRAERAVQPKGLRRVLGASPAVLVLEQAPEEVVEAQVETRRVARRASVPAQTPRTPRRAVSAREAARTQQASGRAGPVDAAAIAAPVARSSSRRPTERMAARVQQALATPGFVEGTAPVSARSTRAREALLERADAGTVDAAGIRAPLSRAATGYVRRRAARAPEAVLPSFEAESVEAGPEAQAPVAARPRTARQAAQPSRARAPRRVVDADVALQGSTAPVARASVPRPVAPTRRALDRMVAADAVSRPARRRAVGAVVATSAASPAGPTVAPAGARAAASRSVVPRPTAHVALERAERTASAPVGAAARPRRRVVGPSFVLTVAPEAEANETGTTAVDPDGQRRPPATPKARAGRAATAPVMRAAERAEQASGPATMRARRSLVPSATAYLASDLGESPLTESASDPAASPQRGIASRVSLEQPQVRTSVAARLEARDEAPVRRVARRALAPHQAVPQRARRSVLPMAVAYLEAPEDEVLEPRPIVGERVSVRAPRAPVVADRPSRRPRAAASAPPAVARRVDGATPADTPTAQPAGPVRPAAGPAPASPVAAARRSRGRAPIDAEGIFAPSDDVAESPTVRAARRRLARPEAVVSRDVRLSEVPTAYLDAIALPDGVAVEAGEATQARPAARAAQRAVPVVSTDSAGRVLTAGSPVVSGVASEQLVHPLAEGPVAVSPPTVERLARRGGPEASARRVATRPMGPDTVLATPVVAEPVDAAAVAPTRARRRGRALPAPARRTQAPSGRAPVASSARPPSTQGRRTLGATSAAVVRHAAPTAVAGRQLAPAPVERFDWASLVASIAPDLAPRRVRQVLGTDAFDLVAPDADASAGEAAAAPARRRPRARLGLGEIAERTREAVHALGRSERSVLTFDAARRTFGDDARQEHTVVARVEQDADGRVRRVRASRMATGEQVLLAPEQVSEAIDGLPGAPVRRPSQASWVEERATVGRSQARAAAPVAREVPGARLVERAASSDPLQRGARRPVAVGAAEAASAIAPASGLRPAPVVALGAMTLASAALPAVVADEAELGSTQGRRSPSVPVAARVLAPAAQQRASEAPDATSTARSGRTSLRASTGVLAAQDASPGRRALGHSGRARARARARAQVGEQLTRSVERRGSAAPATRGVVRAAPAVADASWSLATPYRPEPTDGVAEAGLDEGTSTPGWARRATEGTSVAVRPEVPDVFLRPRLRTSAGGLLPALARAADPEEVVRVILERSGEAGDLSMLPVAAQRLFHRVSDEAHQVAAAARGERGPRRTSTVSPRMAETVRTEVLQPVQVLRPGARSSAVTQQGVGSSKVMKLANKLMKLIHLAESQGRGDAHKHVRMAEDSAAARAEGGADGQGGAESGDDRRMNIKVLQRDVLQAVLRELEDMRWRREEPNGPSIWC